MDADNSRIARGLICKMLREIKLRRLIMVKMKYVVPNALKEDILNALEEGAMRVTTAVRLGRKYRVSVSTILKAMRHLLGPGVRGRRPQPKSLESAVISVKGVKVLQIWGAPDKMLEVEKLLEK